MKVAIISDTHDRHKQVQRAVEIFIAEAVEYILHAGDISTPDIAGMFSQVVRAKFVGVFGNCDRDKKYIQQSVEMGGGSICSEPFTGEIGGKRVFMTHKPAYLDCITDNKMYDLVVYGHTHKQFVRNVDNTLVVNPGRGQVVIVELEDMSTRVISLTKK